MRLDDRGNRRCRQRVEEHYNGTNDWWIQKKRVPEELGRERTTKREHIECEE